MWYRRLGAHGPDVSEISVGTYLHATADPAELERTLHRAFERGVTLFDTSDSYVGAEQLLGRVVKQIGPDKLVVATKCFFPTSPAPTDRGLSRGHVRDALHASLQRLGVEHVDLLQCHRFDPDVPLAETAAAMGELIREGKVRHWGVSRFTAQQLRDACAAARAVGAPLPVATQEPYHLLKRDAEGELFTACRELGISVIAYAPLAQGVLTGKYRDTTKGARADGPNRATMWHLGDVDRAKAARAAEAAEALGWSPAQLALAWVLRRPEVASALCGASRAAQIDDNVEASGRVIPDGVGQVMES